MKWNKLSKAQIRGESFLHFFIKIFYIFHNGSLILEGKFIFDTSQIIRNENPGGKEKLELLKQKNQSAIPSLIFFKLNYINTTGKTNFVSSVLSETEHITFLNLLSSAFFHVGLRKWTQYIYIRKRRFQTDHFPFISQVLFCTESKRSWSKSAEEREGAAVLSFGFIVESFGEQQKLLPPRPTAKGSVYLEWVKPGWWELEKFLGWF